MTTSYGFCYSAISTPLSFQRKLESSGFIKEALIESELPAVQGRTAKINDVSH